MARVPYTGGSQVPSKTRLTFEISFISLVNAFSYNSFSNELYPKSGQQMVKVLATSQTMQHDKLMLALAYY